MMDAIGQLDGLCSAGSFSGLTLADVRPSISISCGDSTDAYVVIRPDGTIEYGKDYTPDAAAKAFWDALGLERKERV